MRGQGSVIIDPVVVFLVVILVVPAPALADPRVAELAVVRTAGRAVAVLARRPPLGNRGICDLLNGSKWLRVWCSGHAPSMGHFGVPSGHGVT